MASALPPPPKRQRREELSRSQTQQDVRPEPAPEGNFLACFVDEDEKELGSNILMDFSRTSERDLSRYLNMQLGRDDETAFINYRFHIRVGDETVHQFPRDVHSFHRLYQKLAEKSGLGGAQQELAVTFITQPQSVFVVRPVTRAAQRMPGHGQSILDAQFSPRSSDQLATGSGDNTARIWDTLTGTPQHKLAGHTGWVLCVAWAPDASSLATGSMDRTVRLWDPKSGKMVGKQPLSGHADRITALAWEPFHSWRDGSPRLASASKDATVRIWVVNSGVTEHVLSGHRANVSCVRWGGADRIYTASHDRTVRVWNAVEGTLEHTLVGHAHWVNHLALSTDFALRTGYFDHEQLPAQTTEAERREKAKKRFVKAAARFGKVVERVVTASEDCTMFLWDPDKGNKPIARLHGHQKQVNHVTFSPNGSLIASAAWDNQAKIWNARDGKFIATLRGHVAPVYKCSFSADSQLLVTSSKDTTLKVWNMETFKLSSDLPGHLDEVYTVDWSPDGARVGSGGRDKAVRLWSA